EEAKKYLVKAGNLTEHIAVLDFRLGMVYFARNENAIALEMLEEVKRIWEKTSSDLLEQNQIEMKIMAIKQKMHSGKSPEYSIKVPNRPNLGDIANTKELFEPVMKLMTFDKDQGNKKILEEMMSAPEDERDSDEINKRLANSEEEPLTEEAIAEKAELFAQLAKIQAKYGMNLRAFYDFTTAAIFLLQVKKEDKAEEYLKKAKEFMKKLPFNQKELWLIFYSNVTLGLVVNNPEKAIEFGREWQKLAESMKNLHFEARSYSALGQAYEKQDTAKAKENFVTAVKMFEELEDKFALIDVFRKYGDFLERIGDEDSKSYQDKSKTILNEMVEAGATQIVKS
ncbi:MAG: hypothetical protein ACTSQ4_07645, partial [Candidatus Heimdallarchaeaceae archaeon]